ncbi:hypothetical protein R5N98_03735 [Tenacibaculum maritimum]|uniref:hypothetical protein n=1 Tax=Tenacibaculum maritimum TaxID=107401 RepID=UPI0012E6C84E|nr:hypothetical protein [Tenacibaculum maritimum]CAA0163098.1 hypothetical protein TFA04_110103 [Tenacibaculum maritimum]CAA0198303.1 conserved hypothetical protein [Tenacibaculum maritimum]CAA0257550.1 conserved hypothetical protein [Tenacibaculum maritimum]
MDKLLIALKIIASIYMVLLGFGIVNVSKSDEKNKEWRIKYSLFFKIAGFFLLIHSLFQLLSPHLDI